MTMNKQQKDKIKKEIVRCLENESEIRRIVVFGSFLYSSEPHDLDLAIFQDSEEAYLPLALKYRRRIRNITRLLPVDVLPIRPDPQDHPILREIKKGEVLYER